MGYHFGILGKWTDNVRDGVDDAWDDLTDSVRAWEPEDLSNVFKDIVKSVENTAAAIADKPIQFVIQVGTSLLAPHLSPFVNAAIAAENGAEFDDILRNVVFSAVAPKVSEAVGDYTSTALTELNISPNLVKSTSEIVSDVVSKVGKGGDLEFALATSFINSARDPLQSAVKEFTNFFSDLETEAFGTDIISPEVQDAIAKGVDIVAKTGTVTDAMVGLFSEQLSELLDKTTGLVGEGFDDDLTRAITASVVAGFTGEDAEQAYYGSLRKSSEQKLGALFEKPIENIVNGLIQKQDGTLVTPSGVVVSKKGVPIKKDGKIQIWETGVETLPNGKTLYKFNDGSSVVFDDKNAVSKALKDENIYMGAFNSAEQFLETMKSEY